MFEKPFGVIFTMIPSEYHKKFVKKCVQFLHVKPSKVKCEANSHKAHSPRALPYT